MQNVFHMLHSFSDMLYGNNTQSGQVLPEDLAVNLADTAAFRHKG